MVSKLIGLAFKTALGRWILGAAVALLLGSAGLMWHNHKQGLREEGRQECIQTVNEETLQILQEQLVAERAVIVELINLGIARNILNDATVARRQAADAKVSELKRQIAEQERTDETYNTWANTPLPTGVRNRLQLLRATDN